MATLVVTALLGCSQGEEASNADRATPASAEGARGIGEWDAGADADSRAATAIQFRDRTGDSGVAFTYRNGQEAGHAAILESLGGGVAAFDYDGDGDLDLFFTGGGQYEQSTDAGGADAHPQVLGLPPALYRNDGDWHFTETTTQAGLAAAPYYSHGAAAADYDADGHPDLLVTGYGGLLLWRNQGDGTFREVAQAAGLDDRLWSTSAAWGDVTGDGYLDLYVAHYVNWSFDNHPYCRGPNPGDREVCSPRQFDPLPDVLYVSRGDGTFRDASEEAGLVLDPERCGKGLGVLMADLDLDGDLDIYVGNDTVPNFLYRNDGRGRFEEIGLMSGTALSDTATPDGSMGVDVGDFNLDGLPDLWVANFERESFALYRNEGDCLFRHVSQLAGVTAVGGLYVGWGTVFADFDHDGDEDVFCSNGHVIRFPTNAPLRQAPLLFENRGGERFVNVAPTAGSYMQAPHMGRGVATGDFDNDGDMDLAVVHTNEPVALLSNESATHSRAVTLRVIGTAGPRDPVGARVRLRTSDGEQARQIKGGTSYASTHDRRIFFGLGSQPAIDAIEITWPSGAVQSVDPPEPGRTLLVREGMAQLTGR